MKRILSCIAALGVALSFTAAASATAAVGNDKVLYNFENGTDGWWTYQSEATLTLAQDKTGGAGGSTGSLEATYKYDKGGAYLGIGIQPKWAMGGKTWQPYATGHLAISFKSDANATVRIELRSADKETYSYTIHNVPEAWKDYSINFSEFMSKKGSIDLNGAPVNQMVIIPTMANTDEHHLWMDNVTLCTAPVAMSTQPSAPVIDSTPDSKTNNATDKTLYNFENGTDGWWTYQGDATVSLSQDKTGGADGSAGSLEATYKYDKGGAYLGIGIQPKWAMGGKPWQPYANGHLAISFKSDANSNVRIELRSADKQTYSYTIPNVPEAWKDYSINFSEFKSKNGSIDLNAATVDQMVIVPTMADTETHHLWMDNVTLCTGVAK